MIRRQSPETNHRTMAHKTTHHNAKQSRWSQRALIATCVISTAAAGILVVDQVTDGQPETLQRLGVVPEPMGPTEMTGPTAGPADVPPQDVLVAGQAAQDHQATDDGLPTEGMDGIDLSRISTGGGQGADNQDWSTMHPSELAIPAADLRIPMVPRGLISLDATTQEMDLPVSFQAGWLTSSSSVSSTQGTTVVAGHVNWADGSWAPMSNLYNAQPGMTVLTTDPSGALQSWKVTSSSSVPQNELSHLFTLTDTQGPRELVLITCEASIDNQGNLSFDKNHVVTAVPQP